MNQTSVGALTAYGIGLRALAALLVLAVVSRADATIVLSDFSNFNLTGTYEQWNSGTFTSGPTDWRVQANNFGGGWKEFAPQINASGENKIEIVVTANPANVATNFNLVLFSGSPSDTQAGWSFNVAPGTQTLTADLNTPMFFNSGSIATWNKANIGNQFHLQGTFGNGNPGLAMDLTFDNLSLVPEPSAIALVGLVVVGISGVRRRFR